MAAATLILTRPEKAARAFHGALDPAALRDIDVIFAPLIDILPTGIDPLMQPGEGAIFTSQAAVDLAPAGNARRAYCVGEATTGAAQAAGWDAQYAGSTGDALVASLMQQMPDRPLVHLSGQHIRVDITGALRRAGWQARQVTVYDQHLLPLSPAAKQAVQSRKAAIVPLFSPRTAAQFIADCPEGRHTTLIALSDAVAAQVMPQPAMEVITVPHPNAEEMRMVVEKLCRNHSLS